MAIGRVNTGGSGSGGTLTVTGIAGHTVTATKDGKTYTRTFNSSGVAVFKGLSTGTWTLTMTGGGQTATRTVTVNADYAVTITYFSATISITYPANSTCVVTNNGGQTVASDTNTGSSTKTWTATVNATGTYTVTATATDGSGKSKSQSIEITSEGQAETVTLIFELVLFDGSNGGDVTALTGGWEAEGHVPSNIVFSVGSDKISFNYAVTQTQGTIKRTWFIYTKNSINMANYTTLHITFATMSGGDKWGIGVNTEIPSDIYSDNPSLTAKTATTTIKNNQTLTLSISNISKGYVMAYVSKSFADSISMACDITRVWLE